MVLSKPMQHTSKLLKKLKAHSLSLLMTLDFETTEDPPTLLQAGEQETTKTSAIYSRMDSSMYLP